MTMRQGLTAPLFDPRSGSSPRMRIRPLFRAAQSPRSTCLTPLFALAYIVLSLMAYAWTTATGGLALLWLCNGLVAAAVLLLPAASAIGLLALGAATDFTCAVALGHTPVHQAALIASLDACEAVGAAALARRYGGAALDVTRLRRLAAIVGLAVAPATLAAGTLGAALSVITLKTPFIDTWIAWAVGDFLGMSIALPATLLIARFQRFGPPAGAKASLQALLALGAGAAALGVFVQHDLHGLIMLAPMVMLFETFVAAPAVVAVSVVLVAFIASGLTIAGYGPIAEDEPGDIGRRILTLELALSIVALSSWIATALVAERDRAQRGLAKTVAVAQAARRKAAESARAKSDFLANMSHEIRTPLNGVIAVANVLAKSALSPRQAEMVELIRSSGGTLQSLLDDILDTSKIEAGKIELDLRPIDLEAEVRAAALPLRVRAEEKGLLFTLEVAASAKGSFLSDPLRIRQIIANLAANAVKFTHAGEVKITVAALPDGDAEAPERICLQVEDTGVGFDAETGKRLFQRFSQGDSSVTRTYGGAGLGLGIVKSLATLLGGEVSAASTPGVGSVFTVTLPMRRLAEASPAPETPASEAPTPETQLLAGGDPADPRPLRVLVAEDNPTNQKVVALILEPFGAELDFADNGLAAVELFKAKRFDLVLMDMQMPHLDGLSATRRIRELEAAEGRSHTPIAMLSANAMAQHLRQAEAAGCDLHISKPVTPAALVAGVEQALAAAKPAPAVARQSV